MLVTAIAEESTLGFDLGLRILRPSCVLARLGPRLSGPKLLRGRLIRLLLKALLLLLDELLLGFLSLPHLLEVVQRSLVRLLSALGQLIGPDRIGRYLNH